MRTTTALPVLLALALPALAMANPCEAEVAKMNADLDAIRGAVATFQRLRPSDDQRRMLAAAKEKYDREVARTAEAQARCEKLVQAESPGAPKAAAAVAPAAAVPAAVAPGAVVPAAAAVAPVAPVPAAPPAVVPAPVAAAPAPAAALPVVAAPVAVAAVPAVPAAAAAPPVATPCLTGCGKDTDCKGARICVNGSCQDPPSR